jgi:DNA polymerase-3 subunit epsilon
MPEQLSHSLGKLVRALGILWQIGTEPVEMQWRQLFKMLLDKDLEKEIIKEMPVCKTENVYYIYNESGTLIYIGKSINIRKITSILQVLLVLKDSS